MDNLFIYVATTVLIYPDANFPIDHLLPREFQLSKYLNTRLGLGATSFYLTYKKYFFLPPIVSWPHILMDTTPCWQYCPYN